MIAWSRADRLLQQPLLARTLRKHALCGLDLYLKKVNQAEEKI